MSTVLDFLSEEGFSFGNSLLTVGERGRYFQTLDTVYLRGDFSSSRFKDGDREQLTTTELIENGLESGQIAYHEYGHYRLSTLTIDINAAFVRNYISSYKLEQILQGKQKEEWTEEEAGQVIDWLEECRDLLQMLSVYWDPIQELFARYIEADAVETDTEEMLQREIDAIEDYEAFQPEEDLFIPPYSRSDRREIELLHNFYLRQCLQKLQQLVDHYGEEGEVTKFIHLLAMVLPNGYTASLYGDQNTSFTTIVDFDVALNVLLNEITIQENIKELNDETEKDLLSRLHEHGLAMHSLTETREGVIEELESIDEEIETVDEDLAERFKSDTESIKQASLPSLYIVERTEKEGLARLYNNDGMSEWTIKMSLIRSLLSQSISQRRNLLSDQLYTDYLQDAADGRDPKPVLSEAVEFYEFVEQNGLI